MSKSEIIINFLNSIAIALADAIIDATPLLRPVLRTLGMEKILHQSLGVRRESVDERVRKIELARGNLIDALSAMDELQANAEESRKDLERLSLALVKASTERDGLVAYNKGLKEMTTEQEEVYRRFYGIPTPRQVLRGQIISFFAGIIITLALALVYDFAVKPLFLWLFPQLGV